MLYQTLFPSSRETCLFDEEYPECEVFRWLRWTCGTLARIPLSGISSMQFCEDEEGRWIEIAYEDGLLPRSWELLVSQLLSN
jgi:hypothetical protein